MATVAFPESHSEHTNEMRLPSISSLSFQLPGLRTQSPKTRLSLGHGASHDAITDYVTGLGHSLRRRILQGEDRNWIPRTPDVTSCYKFVREVGRGHYGVVRICEDLETRQLYACKTMAKASIKVRSAGSVSLAFTVHPFVTYKFTLQVANVF